MDNMKVPAEFGKLMSDAFSNASAAVIPGNATTNLNLESGEVTYRELLYP